MVSKVSLIKSLLLLIAVFSTTLINASPFPFQKQRREVGSLSCYTTKIGKLYLYNLKTKEKRFATFQNDYTLKQESSKPNSEKIPKNAKSWQNYPLLSSYPQVNSEMARFEFLQCDEDQQPGFENFPAENSNGTYYGHLSPISSKKPLTSENPSNCTTYRQLYGDTAYLTSEICNFSDDSGSVLSYFSYDPSKNGQIKLLGYTGPKGQEPETEEQKQGAYDFTPGTNSSNPVVNVHDGSKQFSNWILRLE